MFISALFGEFLECSSSTVLTQCKQAHGIRELNIQCWSYAEKKPLVRPCQTASIDACIFTFNAIKARIQIMFSVCFVMTWYKNESPEVIKKVNKKCIFCQDAHPLVGWSLISQHALI